MKTAKLIVIVLLFTSCTSLSRLNRQIIHSQNESVAASPFSTAKSMGQELKAQKKYRKLYLEQILNWKSKYPNDTLLLTENYDFICLGCPADLITISSDSITKTLTKGIREKTYTPTDNYPQPDLDEIFDILKSGKVWNENPKQFGDENCLDGGQTFYTVLFPSGKVESMYMRCWVDKQFRKELMKNK